MDDGGTRTRAVVGELAWRRGVPRTRRHCLAGGTALAGAALAACAGGGATGDRQAAGPAGGKLKAGVELTLFNDLGGAYQAVMEEWARTFRERTGVTVKPDIAPDRPTYTTKLPALFSAGTPPDLFRFWDGVVQFPAAVERSMFLALDDRIKRDRYDLADFRPDSVRLWQWKGKQQGLPRDFGHQLLYYNQELLREAGVQPPPPDWADRSWTFDRFLDACQRLTRRDGATVTRWAVTATGALRDAAIYSNSGRWVRADEDGIAREVLLAETPATDALQLLQDLVHKHKVAPTPAEERAAGNWQGLWAAGKVAMVPTNPSDNEFFRRTPMSGYDVGVLPLGPRGTRRGTGGGGTCYAAAPGTRTPDEAWALLSHICSREGELVEVRAGATTPARVSVVTSPEFLQPDKPPQNARVFADGQEYVVRGARHPRWDEINREHIAPSLDAFWSGAQPAVQVAREIKGRVDPLLAQR